MGIVFGHSLKMKGSHVINYTKARTNTKLEKRKWNSMPITLYHAFRSIMHVPKQIYYSAFYKSWRASIYSPNIKYYLKLVETWSTFGWDYKLRTFAHIMMNYAKEIYEIKVHSTNTFWMWMNTSQVFYKIRFISRSFALCCTTIVQANVLTLFRQAIMICLVVMLTTVK